MHEVPIMKHNTAAAIIICIITVVLSFALNRDAAAVLTELDEARVAEAISFGRTHRDSINDQLQKSHCVGACTFYSPHVIVRTRWYKLARQSALKAGQSMEMLPVDIRQILNDPCLQIDTVVYGQSLNFARDYRIELEQNGKTILPVKTHADHSSVRQHGRTVSGFPNYQATVRSYFSYTSFDPQQSAVLKVIKDGSSTTFTLKFCEIQ